MFKNRPKSHIILIIIFLVILITGSIFTMKVSNNVMEIASSVSRNMKNTMDPKAPDPGKTQSENLVIPSTSKKVIIGSYLERVEDLNVKESSWSYEFYLWFKWKSSEIDFLGKRDKNHKNELPFSIINGDVIKCDIVNQYYDSVNNIEYIQYFVKAKNTQFFDVSLYPIDKHDLIIPIEHKWLDKNQLYFQLQKKKTMKKLLMKY